MNELTVNFTPILLTFFSSFLFGGLVVYFFVKLQDKQNQRTYDYSMKIEQNRTDICLSKLKNPTENDKIFRILISSQDTRIDELTTKYEQLEEKIYNLTKVVGRSE